ncbi:MAG TPA: tRNA (adenosine(37)-N6)-threonylcarbamoyltransferase complex dimerization subunit type 1 TsaB [Ktedonobacteraceae bacterium]|nr:tRNA (adenosine(37)-N6)-threonylcarbamoyltransferase complex dimerization subunit type 1 TsaB [Ktedonobacteraceae bacterium]
MLLLALDTSTRQASVALCTEDQLLGEYSWHIGNNHSVELLDRIQRLSGECDTPLSALDAIAVATGPGSFNGVRVALATAKALAFALQKPLVGVSTLDSIAAGQGQWPGLVCSLLEAGRSELYAACYLFEVQEGVNGTATYSMLRLSDYLLLAPQQLSGYLQEQLPTWMDVVGGQPLSPFLFCGEISTASREALREQMQEQALFAGGLQSTRHASVLAQLARQRLESGDMDDPLSLEPLYLRRPSITTSTRKQPLLGGGSQAHTQPQRLADSRPTGSSQTEREEGALRH